jgi:hypothetical protein
MPYVVCNIVHTAGRYNHKRKKIHLSVWLIKLETEGNNYCNSEVEFRHSKKRKELAYKKLLMVLKLIFFWTKISYKSVCRKFYITHI